CLALLAYNLQEVVWQDESLWRAVCLHRIALGLGGGATAEPWAFEPLVPFTVSWQATACRLVASACGIHSSPSPSPRKTVHDHATLAPPRCLHLSDAKHHAGFAALADDMEELTAILAGGKSGLKEIDVVHPEERVSAAVFMRRYHQGRQPVVVRNAAGAHFTSDTAAWRLPALAAKFPDRQFPCVVQGATSPPTTVRMTMATYARYVEEQSDAEPLYLFEWQVPPDLLRNSGTPDFFEEDYLEAVLTPDKATEGESSSGTGVAEASMHPLDAAGFEHQWLVAGPAGSGSRFHKDPFSTSAWNVLLEGRKLWCFYPPDDDTSAPDNGDAGVPPGVPLRHVPGQGILYEPPASVVWFLTYLLPRIRHGFTEPCTAPPAPPSTAPLRWVEQREGDIVFVPFGWWHCVVNLETSVAFTKNIVNRTNYRRAIDDLSPHHAEVAAAIKTHVWRLHNDSDDDSVHELLEQHCAAAPCSEQVMDRVF
ncbi:hypothetical protein CYMTET_15478, partial [Cymbomonas tetramitiformis]